MKEIYLDNAATTPTDPLVAEAMAPYINTKYGNPSTIYKIGRENRNVVEGCRDSIAAHLGAEPREIYFTSCGTESDNFAIKGMAWAKKDKGNHIITSSVEHHAVIETCKYLEKTGFEVTYLPVDEYGAVKAEDVKKAVKSETILISVMHGNNEIGTIQPVKEIGEFARERNITMHTDAVQTVGHLPVNVGELNADLLSLSAHKFYGPTGVDALYIKNGIKITPLLHGGEQERRRRAGTENVAGIVGMTKALDLAVENMVDENKREAVLRDKLIDGLMKLEYTKLNGHPGKRLPNNVNIAFQYVEGESIILNLDALGIYVSTGSACSSATLEPSHVLINCGLPHEIAHGSIRFSLGRETTEEDIDTVIRELPPVIEKLRAMSPLYEEAIKGNIK